jgi:energy-coupling factor transporter ATP-binding protein EcfA2
MEKSLQQRLANQLASGKLILFTGAGFSLSAYNSSGSQIPSVRVLREVLWEIAFPNIVFDNESSLGDIYEVATKRAGGRVRQILRELLTVDGSRLPECYRKWYSFPWLRSYTLNVDDIDEVIQRAFSLPRPVKSISALTDNFLESDAELLSIHLNGKVSEYPDVTFSPRQYGERTARHEPWYYHLVSDLLAHPILFVGTVLDEPLLWQHIELRKSRNRQLRELRPGSYLVTPAIPEARKAMLDDFNIKLIQMGQEEFLNGILETMEVERVRGLTTIGNRQASRLEQKFLHNVADLRLEKDDGSSDFLLGREPFWADITSGRAVKREFENTLKESIGTKKENIVVITGTAGSGKSTTLMRLSLAYQAEGVDVGWLDSEIDIPLRQIRDRVKKAAFQILIIDDADNFGMSIGSLLADFVSDNPNLIVIAGMRSTKFDRLQVEDYLNGHPHLLYAIPHLENTDIELLIEALTKANRLGHLRGLTLDKQIRIFQEQAGRQLLVAMIQATSNERFEEKIDSECRELPKELGLIYCIVAIATSLKSSLTKDEILTASGDLSNEQLNRIERLLNQRLLISHDSTHIRLRHRIVADRAVEYYKRDGSIREPLLGLLWAIATKSHVKQSRKSREQRILLQLINHRVLMKLTSDQETPRLAYNEIEDVLGWNYHYYLQRGSYEVQAGNLDLAKNFLDQARAMEPDDYLVQTEWSYMTLKRAALNASSLNSSEGAEEAFVELEDAIARRGKLDYYPYHVLGSQGLSWIRRMSMTPEEKRRNLTRILTAVQNGVSQHPHNNQLVQLERDIFRERLMLTVN